MDKTLKVVYTGTRAGIFQVSFCPRQPFSIRCPSGYYGLQLPVYMATSPTAWGWWDLKAKTSGGTRLKKGRGLFQNEKREAGKTNKLLCISHHLFSLCFACYTCGNLGNVKELRSIPASRWMLYMLLLVISTFWAKMAPSMIRGEVSADSEFLWGLEKYKDRKSVV